MSSAVTGSPAAVDADRDLPEAPAEVGEIPGDRDDRHHLRRGGDVEAGLARNAVCAPAEPDHDLAQGAVVHVEASPPGDRARVDAELVPVLKMRVDHCSEQVVRGADGVDVACEVEVDELGRHDLRTPAAGATALDAEDWAE